MFVKTYLNDSVADEMRRLVHRFWEYLNKLPLVFHLEQKASDKTLAV